MLPSSVFGKESMRVMWMIMYHTLNNQNDIQQPHAFKVVCFVKLWGCDLTMVATSVTCIGFWLIQSVFTVTFNEIISRNSCPNFLPVRQPLSIFVWLEGCQFKNSNQLRHFFDIGHWWIPAPHLITLKIGLPSVHAFQSYACLVSTTKLMSPL